MRVATIVLAGAVLVSCPWASAIPNAAANPHPNTAPDITWQQDTTKDPEQSNHFHMPLRSGETITVSSELNSSYGLRSNKGWGAHQVWDDNVNRFEDTPDQGDGRNAILDRFAHGYINPSKTPLYEFESSVPADAKPLLKDAFDVWETAAKAQSNGKTSPAGKALQTSIKFKEKGSGETAQFNYRFSTSFQGARNAYAEWITSQDRVPLGGGVGGNYTMVYESDPSNFVRAPAGVTLKLAGGLISTNTYTRSVGWSFDKTPDPIVVDLQYVKNDQTFEALPGEFLTTDTGLQIEMTDKINFYQMDFWTIALHETGHILGLLHSGDPVDNIMRENIFRQAAWNRTLQQIDADSAYGAALLYTIPVPEPSLAAGALGATVWGIRRRRLRCPARRSGD